MAIPAGDGSQHAAHDDAPGITAQHEGDDGGGASRNLFDLRTIIGGLFTVYGVFLIILGLLDSDAAVEQAAGVRINLWTGLGMLALGLGFLLWVKLRPLKVEELVAAQEADGTEELEHEGIARGSGPAGH